VRILTDPPAGPSARRKAPRAVASFLVANDFTAWRPSIARTQRSFVLRLDNVTFRSLFLAMGDLFLQ
jgi:hypothetical protein